MVDEFADTDGPQAHARFQQWRSDYPGGYFINCRSEFDGMLHRAPCGRHGDTDTGPEAWGSLTRHRKACSVSLHELRAWAKLKNMRPLQRCSTCKPE